MLQSLRFILSYFKYVLNSHGRHGLHSPFVYHLMEKVILDKSHYYGYEDAESIRSFMLLSDKLIETTDFGAGSHFAKQKKRKISDIARHSAKPKKYSRLLFKLVKHFQPSSILELGTSLGISTIYQAKANSSAKVITLEGCPETAAIAKENFKKLKLENIKIIGGDFTDTLSEALAELTSLDYVFFDGNHQKGPTLDYFEKCLSKAGQDSLFIFDDIHWSKGMEEAWEEIKNRPEVTVSIDLFFLGLIFFRKEQAKQHFVLRF